MDNSLRKWRITHHSNKIGLFDTEKQSFTHQSGDVVLSFPYKDCVLEWGMSSEEVGREEKFFHETMDRADIDVLREPKVLTGFEKIDTDGVHTITDPSTVEFFDVEGNLTENLLIKGNNLIALYSLRSRLAGKVKLIYIDPPYNTGSDGFRYNDNFNHSSWLVFMKNRLELARELLREDGVICISCDDNEQAYLKVLSDEVLGVENFIQTWVVNRSSEIATAYSIQQHEYFIIYSKNKSLFKIDSIEKFTISRWTVWNIDQTTPVILFPKGLKCQWIQDWTYNETRKIEWSLENVTNLDPIVIKNWILVEDVRLQARWRSSGDMRNFFENNCKPTQAKINWIVEEIYFENDRFNPQIRKRTFEKIPSLILENKKGSKDLESTWVNFAFPKSEFFIKILIEIITKSWDIVLDYHLWSGTTAAVAHKMGRRWIGIEQMDYIEDIAKVRLQKVIEWEQGGISKSVDWQWGGTFVYMELRTYNIEYLERIESARTKEELHAVYADMARNAFLQFWFDRKNWEKDEKYTSLPLEEQKVKLRELLDMNQLYLNAGDMYDTRHSVSPLDQSLTAKFYGKKD